MGIISTRRDEGGLAHLALRFPAGAIKGAGTALAAAMNEEGRLVRPGPGGGASISPWRFGDVERDEAGGYLLGPAFEGSSLDGAEGLESGMPLLLSVARALAALQAEGALPRALVSPGVLAGPGGDVLVLPPTAAARALAAGGPEARAAAAARLSSSLSGGAEADASFFLAQAAYRIATGRSAFADDHGTIASPSRRGIPASLAAPALDAGLAALTDAALADPREVGLAAWVGALERASAAGWTRALAPDEAAELDRRRAAALADSEARRRRADFWRKRGGIVAAVAVGLALVGLVAADMLRAQRDRPDFSWLSARELVQRYYMAVDSIDLESLEACIDKKQVKADWDYVMNMTVLTKTRMAYEGKSPLLRAVDWVAAGKPALAETDLLYGIVGLEIEEEGGSSPPRASFRATYSFWRLDRKDDPSGNPSKATSVPLEERRVDRLALVYEEKGGWRIVGLDRRLQP